MIRESMRAMSNGKEVDRRRTILRAAVEVFAKKGYHGCRIADVAKEAKVAYGLVYHYFKNKDELLRSVFEAGWAGFVSRLREAAQAGSTLEEKVRGVVRVAFDSYRQDPRAVKVLILEIGRSGGRVNRGGAFAEVIQLATAMFEEARVRGELAAGADPLLCAAMLFGAIELALTAFVVGLLDRRSEESLLRARARVAEVFLRGVLPAREESWKTDRSNIRQKADGPS
ncbi:MAG: TetR/AcrR family transcriptional regulator [Myxococcales bacterium]|nr:TetR/AcrR family transcriptional regulator [Myxococcales bacterium]